MASYINIFQGLRKSIFVPFATLPFLASPASTDINRIGNASVVAFGSPSISEDGSRIAFATRSQLVSSDPLSNSLDIYVQDNSSLTMITNGETNGLTFTPSISKDGRYITYVSFNSSLLPGGADTNNLSDIFRYDMNTGSTIRVNLDSDENQTVLGNSGVYASGSVSNPPPVTGKGATNSAISENGRYVTFQSNDPDLDSRDNNNNLDIFLRDTTSGTTEIISLRHDGAQVTSSVSRYPSISPDGCHIAFESNGQLGVEGVLPTFAFHPYVYNQCTDTLTTLGQSSSWAANRNFGGFAFSDASLFYHARIDDVTSTLNTYVGIYQYDLSTGTKTEVQRSGVADVHGASASEDNRFLIYLSGAPLEPGVNANGFQQLFVHDLTTDAIKLVSADANGLPGNGDTGFHNSNPQISANGCKIVFESFASNLVSNDSNGVVDYFVADNPMKPAWECGAPQPQLNFTIENNSSDAQAHNAFILIAYEIDFLIPMPGGDWNFSASGSSFTGSDFSITDASTHAYFEWTFTTEVAGLYDFHANIPSPANGNNTSDAVYTIEHANGEIEINASQAQAGNIWLTQQRLEANTTYRISLRGASDAMGDLVADSVSVEWVGL